MTSKKFKQKGYEAFKELNFDLAKNYFSFAINSTNSEEIIFLVSLCEIAKDNFDDANMLFEFYLFLLKENRDMSELGEILTSIESKVYEANYSKADAITFDELQEVVASGVDFKDALSAVMTSTKLIIKDSDNFLDFILSLLDNGLEESAISYFETFLEIHGSYDKKTELIARKIKSYEDKFKR